jgi:serine/threonine protein kinase/WD40 repeat protein
MADDRYQRIKQLTQRALELAPEDRNAFLVRECGDDDALLHDVQRLLEFDDSRAEDLTVRSLPEPLDLAGQTLGPYEIIERLGEGGMGVVYLAAQSAPLRRKVAVKVIKLGMDTREVITRFRSERQALALMDHPSIAKVLDAGATPSGRPFFVMEYIQGVTLTRYCRDHGLGLRRRLELFVQVCRGVQHAHQKGVIHRDLKPGNILVTEVEGEPVPKIIDFGVAKATGQHLAERTFFTQLGRVIGTPEYMSPEQADIGHQDVDTRSDVFSLGVILYELLTGVLPIDREDLLRAGYDRIATLVREVVPPRPSTRLTSLDAKPPAQRRDTAVEPRTWGKRVRGDLDWVTMKALEKERDRRYESAAELASDLARHMSDQAVTAGPPSRTYRARKFVRRNRLAVTAAAAVMLAVIGIAVWQTAQSRIIARERDRAMANERLSLARERLDSDPTLAVAYAISSLELVDQPAVRDVVRRAIGRGPLRDELPRWGQRGNPVWVDASPDGRLCAVAWSQSVHPTVGIYDLSDNSLRVLEAPTPGIVYIVVFTADGRHVVAAGDGLHVWRVADGQYVHHVAGATDHATYQILRLADPVKVALATADLTERTTWSILNVTTGELTEIGRSIGVLESTSDVRCPQIDPSATWILDYLGERVYLQRVDDLDPERAILVGEHESRVVAVGCDASVETAASMDADGMIKIWDLRERPPRLIRTDRREPGTYGFVFDPFRDRVASIGGSATAWIHPTNRRPPWRPLELLDRTFWTHGATFLTDGSIITSGNGTTVARWLDDPPVNRELELQGNVFAGYVLYDVSPDGDQILMWTRDGDVVGVALTDGVDVATGRLGRTDGWVMGTYAKILMDDRHRRCVTMTGRGRSKVLDLETGLAREIPAFAEGALLLDVSPGGGLACIDDHFGPGIVHIVDLDAQTLRDTLDVSSSVVNDVEFLGESDLVLLTRSELVRHDLAVASGEADTIWSGDASGGGWIEDQGRVIITRDRDGHLTLFDLEATERVELMTTNRWLMTVAHDRRLGLVAVAGWWDDVHVFDLQDGREWRLPIYSDGPGQCQQVDIDPHGRWVMAQSIGRTLAWSLPLDPVFADMPGPELLASLRRRTNVRVVPDASSASGFRITSTAELEADER